MQDASMFLHRVVVLLFLSLCSTPLGYSDTFFYPLCRVEIIGRVQFGLYENTFRNIVEHVLW